MSTTTCRGGEGRELEQNSHVFSRWALADVEQGAEVGEVPGVWGGVVGGGLLEGGVGGGQPYTPCTTLHTLSHPPVLCLGLTAKSNTSSHFPTVIVTDMLSLRPCGGVMVLQGVNNAGFRK